MTGTIQFWLSIFLILDAFLPNTSVSNAWVAVPTVPCSRGSATGGKTELRCSGQRLDAVETATTMLSRRSVVQLFSLVSSTAALKLASPAEASAAEVDPFAAMDDMLSSGGGLPSSPLSGPGGPAGNSFTSDTKSQDSAGGTTASTSSPPTAQNSDMAAALRESSKKRKIDPRTHG